ncbi:MAG: UMP kinase [Patescibacteria group bacterium]
MRKILLKLSGESLGKSGVDAKTLRRTVREIASAAEKNSLAIVIGGGNIWRFRDKKSLRIARVESDFLGMTATVFNAVALKNALANLRIRAKVFSATKICDELAEKYSASAARKFLAKKGVALLAGGTGKSGVTTDTAAALRAVELGCDLVVKATNVAGIFDRDPRKSRKAKLLKEVCFAEVLTKNLGVMDRQAFEILGKKKIPIRVFNFAKTGLLKKAVAGENVGSLIF